MKHLLTYCCLCFLYSSVSHAALTMNFAEVGPDVVATVNGSIGSLSAATGTSANNPGGGITIGTSAIPSALCALTAGATAVTVDIYLFNDWSNTSTCNTGDLHLATANTGDHVGIISRSTSGLDGLEVPAGYGSGDLLNGTSTWAGQTLASMGLVTGTYAYTWGGIEFPADTLTVTIAAPNPTYTVGGSVSGLTGAGLELQNSGGDTRAIAADGPFVFLTPLADTVSYVAAVSAQPTGQTCSVISGGSNSDGSGTIAAADVTDIVVTCVDDAPAQPVPTLPQWALITLAMLLAGVVFVRRKQLS